MPKIRRHMVTLLSLIILSSSCAALTVKTWLLEGGELKHGTERMSPSAAEGYRCYSLADDTAWREELKLQRDCCMGGGR